MTQLFRSGLKSMGGNLIQTTWFSFQIKMKILRLRISAKRLTLKV
ncbi:hypothetical protein YQE_03864, partial [Dendroctonus ponderosae]